ncbi:hypothetical protein [Flavobacterium phycosphaerae]|uniref:hypothetical protein n=1 Tax=Flavobacterium phycosphaerae TaxID=2697515 RepID=UPI001389F3F5|nr:hypothetical protein [Flavobacterium phycosphaerae]
MKRILALAAIVGSLHCFAKTETPKKVLGNPVLTTVFDCPVNIIIINVSKLKRDGVYDTWTRNNQDLICNSNFKSAKCEYESLAVNLLVFDDRIAEFTWLNTNSDYICYDESYAFLEQSRLINIPRSTIDDHVRDAAEEQKKTFTLRQMIDLGLDLNRPNYRQFVKIDDSSGTAVLQVSDGFEENKTCYSIPFIISIVKDLKITNYNDLVFTFVKVRIDGVDAYAFNVTYPGLDLSKKYYDFSTRPGFGLFGNENKNKK